MSNSFEAQENERLQRALREEQARHDAKVADVKALEKRIGELRRELDTAAALHREVKARLEGENVRLLECGKALQQSRDAAIETNTRLLGCIAAVWCPVCTRRVWMQGGGPNDKGPRTLAKHLRGTRATVCSGSGYTLPEVLAPASDKPNCQPDQPVGEGWTR